MKINKYILSIPPYLSTTWDNISSIQIDDTESLLISLLEGEVVSIPNLNDKIIKKIFNSHIAFVETEAMFEEEMVKNSAGPSPVGLNLNPIGVDPIGKMMNPIDLKQASEFPIKISSNLSDGSMGFPMQHNPEQKDAPDLPEEIVKKIAQVSAIFSDENIPLPKPEKNCNCFYCQITKAMHPDSESLNTDSESDEVSDDELRFKSYDITTKDNKNYMVSDPFNPEISYSVHLGKSVGCSCGLQKCEHIKAVLES